MQTKKSKKNFAILGLIFVLAILLVGVAAMYSENPFNLAAGGLLLIPFGMTTLAKDTRRDSVLGQVGEYLVIAADIIYEGAAVGLVIASGHARPLTSVDKFVGFCEQNVNNSAGAAAAKKVRVIKKGVAKLSVSGAVITDVGQPVYAQDDNAFSFLKTAGVFIGYVERFVSSGIVEVAYDAINGVDPYDGLVAETLADNKTLDALDTGKVFFVTVDAKVITLPAVEGMSFTIVSAGAYGTLLTTIASNANDGQGGPDLTSVDDKDLIHTKATAQRGDRAVMEYGDATGWVCTKLVGIWVKE